MREETLGQVETLRRSLNFIKEEVLEEKILEEEIQRKRKNCRISNPGFCAGKNAGAEIGTERKREPLQAPESWKKKSSGKY